MTSIDLLKEIEAWLIFNTEPSKEETAKLRKSIKDHLTEQLRIRDVSDTLCGFFDPDNKTSGATKCKCGREKWEHPKPRN